MVKEMRIAFRIDKKTYKKIVELADEMEEGNISLFLRKLLKVVVSNA